MRPCSAPLLAILLVGCGPRGGSDTGGTAGTGDPYPADRYDFPSRFEPGASSVAHPGQTLRQLLIEDLVADIGELTGRVDAGWFPAPGEVRAELEFYFAFDGEVGGEVPIRLQTDPAPLQTTYGEVAAGASLVEKIAGQDPVGQHEDWETAFIGWEDPQVSGPASLVRHWFDQLDQAAVDRSLGQIPLGADGRPVQAIHLTAEGTDLRELIEKFLHGAVSFSQATDDYLDDDLPGEGLRAGHAQPEEGAPYTALEHHWDEAFGYFGAAHHYPSMSDALIAEQGASDADGDGAIDLGSERCWGASTNAAKRDLGAVVPTDLTAEAWEGFHGGRQLLAERTGPLSEPDLATLRAFRDQAVEAWERALAATVVHYLNAVLQDMAAFGTEDYDVAAHARNWSEGKGFALAFQFNPRSPLSEADFAALHGWLGQAPVLPGDDPAAIEAYAEDLRAARALLGQAYGFDAANLGGDDGTGGW